MKDTKRWAGYGSRKTWSFVRWNSDVYAIFKCRQTGEYKELKYKIRTY